MYYKLEENEMGDFQKDGKSYIINECNNAYTPEGLNVGYTFFETREECLKAWNLTEKPNEGKFN